MGAWGYGSFENDDALDFVAELMAGGEDVMVTDALAQVAGGAGIDEVTASRVLAAAEIFAAKIGHRSSDLPEELNVWLISHLDAIDFQLVQNAVIAVLTDSELIDLWKDSGEYRKWRTGVVALLHRLGGALPATTAKSVTAKSPKACRNHPNIPPLNTRAWRILNKTYWKNGWLSDNDQGSSITAEEKQYAQEAGFLIPDRDMTHDEIISWARQWHSNTPLLQASNAFLASISSRRLEFRSALGSYAVGQHLISHQFDEDRSRSCGICGLYFAEKNCYDCNVLNFERYKWGGVRHEHPEYIAFDLLEFAKLPPCLPTTEDISIFRQIIAAATLLPAKAGPNVLIKQLQGLFPTNSAESSVFISILGFCGILQPANYPAFTDEFIPFSYRGYIKENDWGYPISEWRGADGVNHQALAKFFPQLVD